jgi:hypothetical protein
VGRKGRNACGRNMMTETVNFWNSKSTFVRIQAESTVSQNLEKFLKILKMFLFGLAENQNVIKVDENK